MNTCILLLLLGTLAVHGQTPSAAPTSTTNITSTASESTSAINNSTTQAPQLTTTRKEEGDILVDEKEIRKIVKELSVEDGKKLFGQVFFIYRMGNNKCEIRDDNGNVIIQMNKCN